jgi:hypothetical protein
MSCNDPLYIRQNDCIKETWGKKIINKEYENVDLMFFDGQDKPTWYNDKEYILHVRSEDDLDNTYKKTIYALDWIVQHRDYDYVFRTNTSTYVNVPLIMKFVDYIEKNNQQEVLWVSEIISLVEACAPWPLSLYGRGNGMLLSKENISKLLSFGIIHIYSEHVDDLLMCSVLSTLHIIKGENPDDFIKSFTHGWYRCVEEDNFTNKHQLCEYYNRSHDWDYLKKFVTIQVKQYYHRQDETTNCRELFGYIGDKVDNEIDETFDSILKYSDNPSIFLGSVVGYIDYKTWKGLDKRVLWNIECNNKADNDPHKERMKNKVWY